MIVGDAAGGECVESIDIFIIGSIILSLFIRSESLSLLGLLSNVPSLVICQFHLVNDL